MIKLIKIIYFICLSFYFLFFSSYLHTSTYFFTNYRTAVSSHFCGILVSLKKNENTVPDMMDSGLCATPQIIPSKHMQIQKRKKDPWRDDVESPRILSAILTQYLQPVP